MRKSTKRWLSLVTTLAVAFTMCFESVGVFAETEDTQTDQTDQTITEEQTVLPEIEDRVTATSEDKEEAGGLTVEYGSIVKTFTLAELNEIATEEGNKFYDFTAFNTNPTYRPYHISGPTLRGIFEKAGIDIDSVADNQIIKVSGEDGVTFAFRKNQLMRERYYFPNAKTTSLVGLKPASSAFSDKKAVPAIIAPNKDDGTLMFGQVAPNEQNFSAFCQYLCTGGKITICEKSDNKWNNITKMSVANGAWVNQGTKLSFDISVNSTGMECPKMWVYFSNDGSDPSEGSAIYNYDKWGDFNNPVVQKAGVNTFKVKTTGYGKQDSEVTTFTVNGIPAAPKATAQSTGYSSIRLTWNAIAGASGYQVYRYDSAKKKYVLVARQTARTYNGYSLQTAKAYYYAVEAIVKVGTVTKAGKRSAAVKVIPTVGKPTARVTNFAKKSVVVRWSKVAGANGYRIYRSTNERSGFKMVKKIKKGTTVSFKNKSLKRHKNYYYKVQAYRNVSKKSKYGAFSTVVRGTTK